MHSIVNKFVFAKSDEKRLFLCTHDSGIVYLSNYRLLAINNKRGICIPVRLIDGKKVFDTKVVFSLKTGTPIRVITGSLDASQALVSCIEILLRKKFSSYKIKTDNEITSEAFFRSECNNMGILKNDKWTISTLNSGLDLCKTYPLLLIQCEGITDQCMQCMASVRQKNRLLAISYISCTGAKLLRASQPLNIQMTIKGEFHEKAYLDALLSMHDNAKLYVFDARNAYSSMINYVRGGGTESKEYYQYEEIEFLKIDNIHGLRAAYNEFREIVTQFESEEVSISSTSSETLVNNQLYNTLLSSRWYQQLCLILNSAKKISDRMVNGNCVIVHCTDGWDRTTQLCSLVKIMLDPFYRSIKGFSALIQREWIDFGHQFVIRNEGFQDETPEGSPVFLLFLEAVYQLLMQNPTSFGFNERFLRKLATHSCSFTFRNFSNVETADCSFSDFFSTFNEQNQQIINLLYVRNSSSLQIEFEQRKFRVSNISNEIINSFASVTEFNRDVITPRYDTNSIVFWRNLYLSSSHYFNTKSISFDNGIWYRNDPDESIIEKTSSSWSYASSLLFSVVPYIWSYVAPYGNIDDTKFNVQTFDLPKATIEDSVEEDVANIEIKILDEKVFYDQSDRTVMRF